MRNINCYLCGSNDYTVIFPSTCSESELRVKHIAARKGSVTKEYSHNWVRCKKCGLVYANPIPDEEVLESLYASSDQGGYEEEVENLSNTYGRYLCKYSEYILNKGMALDIGAGKGFFLRTLLGFGFERVRGIEPSAAAFETAPDDVRPFLMNKMYDEKDFEPGTVDFISCFQTLEHMYYPDRFIESLSRLLSKGGVVYCIAHNFGAIGVKILGSRHPIVNAAHLSLFDKKTLAKMFSKDLEVLDVFNVKNRYSLRYWVSLIPINKGVKKVILKACSSLGIDAIPLTLSMGNIGIIARRT